MLPTDIVKQARTWIGTPFHHQARIKGVGCDCLGLLVGVAGELDLKCKNGSHLCAHDEITYQKNPNGTDLDGPDPFVATNQQENFKPISIGVLNQTIITVSYINYDTCVAGDLSEGLGYRGFAEGLI